MNPTRLQFLDPEELAQIGDLELIARTLVQGLRGGVHRSPQAGASIEFAHYRPYVQGEDPRRMDWKLYARSDRLYLKQSLEERNLACTILVDSSASMNFGSGRSARNGGNGRGGKNGRGAVAINRRAGREGAREGLASRALGLAGARRPTYTKFRYAQMLAAALATLLTDQKDAVGLAIYDERIRSAIPARMVRHHLHRILSELERAQPQGRTDTAATLAYLGDVLPPRGMVILISDLLHPLDAMLEHLRSLRAMRHDVLVLQVSDPAERDFTFDEPVTLVDAESETETFVMPERVRREYLENRRRHFEKLREECLKAEIDLREFSTDEPLDYALEAFLRHRRTLARHTHRAGGPGRRHA